MGIIWTIVIGFVAGVIAKFIMPGSNEPSGFVLTTILGIVGAFVASFLGRLAGIRPARVPDSSAPSSARLSYSLPGDSSRRSAYRRLKGIQVGAGRFYLSHTSRSPEADAGTSVRVRTQQMAGPIGVRH